MTIAVCGDGKRGASLANVVCEDGIEPATVEDDALETKDAAPVD
jgi:hypothetical protein